ncbi:NepR family anti-sigma factor [Sphingopyxis sp.]|uniref:NepR family anti-sigma factor n=1 Tax=Sphingopyxis sp. TaxID=1908224 RepID=UPI003D12BA39
MATHGNNRTNGNGRHPRPIAEPRRANGSFPGTSSDQWHRTLTGRQSPEPVSAKLRMIYGNIVAEQLPDDMLDLLSQLDGDHSKSPKQ